MLGNTEPEGKQARPLESKDKTDPCSSGYGASLQDGTDRVFYFIFSGMLGESWTWHLK